MSLWWYWILVTCFYEFVDSKINGFDFKIVFFLYILEHYYLKMFCAFSHILTASRYHLCISLIFHVCGASHHHKKKTHFRDLVLPRLLLLWDYLIFVVNRVYDFPFVRLFLTRCRSILALFFFRLFRSLKKVPWFADFVSSPLPSLFSHLVAVFITACISGGSPFRYVCQSRFR